MHRFPIHVGDEVPGTEPSLLGWAAFLHMLGMGNPKGAGLTGIVIKKSSLSLCARHLALHAL